MLSIFSDLPLRKMFSFQSCKFLNDKSDQNINFSKLPILIFYLFFAITVICKFKNSSFVNKTTVSLKWITWLNYQEKPVKGHVVVWDVTGTMSHNVHAKEFHPWLKGHESTSLQKPLTFTPNLRIVRLLDEIIYWCQTFEKFQDCIGCKMSIFVHVWNKHFHVEVDR